jgi:hypothetical protein
VSLRNPYLVAGGVLSLSGVVLHLATIAGGPEWYRFFGAGERVARMAEAGRWTPAAMAAGIALLLAIAAAYAFSGAGLIRPLPLLRTGLVAITAVYLARGLVVLWPAALRRPDLSMDFMIWSSLIVLLFGMLYLVGTWRAWPTLAQGMTH